jgi:hypothetical protein
MGYAAFGPGILVARRLDIANGPNINIGYANEFSFDLAGNTKQLFGQNQYALVAARGTVKSTGKFKAAVISGIALNAVFFAGTLNAGGDQWVIDEAASVPAPAGPYTITVAGSATFLNDLGMRYSVSGLPLQRVTAGSEATGKYSVNEATGVYTFAVGDASTAMLITYTKQLTGSGQSLTLANQAIGVTPTFQLFYYTNLNQPTSKPYVATIYSCVSSKLSQAFKLEDFMMPELDFDIFANAAGNIMKVTYADVS